MYVYNLGNEQETEI